MSTREPPFGVPFSGKEANRVEVGQAQCFYDTEKFPEGLLMLFRVWDNVKARGSRSVENPGVAEFS
jgi:hypothetical protein